MAASEDAGMSNDAQFPAVWQGWLQQRAQVRAKRNFRRAETSREDLLDLSSNDYLGLAQHPAVRAAASRTLQAQGAGASASRVATGTLAAHRDLEEALCRYTGRAAALAFSSGYTANMGALQALGGPGSHIILDEHAHASLVDGAKLSGASIETAAHNDLHDLKLKLLANGSSGRHRTLVVVESLYSVLGDAAELKPLADLCAEHDALLLVDEAHSLAATTGGSAVAAAGLSAASHVIVTATLSKSLAAQGGAILFGGSEAELLREHIINTARTFIFDTALSPAAAGAATAALDLADAQLLERLRENTDLLARTLTSVPWLADRVEHGAGPILSIRMATPAAAVRTAAALRAAGIAVAVFRPPSVPDGISRLRLTSHAQHEPATLVEAAERIIRCIEKEEKA
ncbi:aminotransferase class I/II-fold pyridoxal phosphate-dependent enzyme [Micrococcoides hystricis]|uniref:8-amino-7-oxononanoate synthase n=1 Tax=Micrococcoides hystricis TaxID=1572761 RepID=A0ABV6P7W1_9MICC